MQTLVNYLRHSFAYFRWTFELDENIFAYTRVEQIDYDTSFDNVSSNILLLVQKYSHVSRFIFLNLRFQELQNKLNVFIIVHVRWIWMVIASLKFAKTFNAWQ